MKKRLAGVLLAILTTVGLVAVAAAPAGAAPAAPAGTPLAVTGTDNNGAPVNGTFYAQRAVRHGQGVDVIGKLVLSTANGTVTTPVQMPVDLTPPATAAAAAAPGAVTPQAVCQVLNLVLGPLHLNLLGLNIDLNQVVLNLTANDQQGLLGQLLCSLAGGGGGGGLGAVQGLLNQVTTLLNQILGGL